jgi:hypothetical protein
VSDPVERAAQLIREVGLAAQRARRYRGLAASVAEPAFERALAIGTAIRQALRDPVRQRAEAEHAAVELATTLERCTRAVAELQTEQPYREALDAVAAGALDRLARIAPAIFTDVEPFPDSRLVFWPVPIAGRTQTAHFLPPSECAERIRRLALEGFEAATPPPDLGADERIPAIVLADEPDVTESPLAVVVEAAAFPAPLCRLAGGSAALFYARRVRLPFRVRAAATLTDEWWAIRPDAYRTYVDELRASLAAIGIELETEAVAD